MKLYQQILPLFRYIEAENQFQNFCKSSTFRVIFLDVIALIKINLTIFHSKIQQKLFKKNILPID